MKHRSPTRRAPAPPSDDFIGIRVAAAVIIVAGLLTYANSLDGPFILDDRRAVVENPQIREIWPLTTSLAPPQETPVAKRPLVNLSFAFNYALHGLDVRGYHAANLLIHLAVALLLFGLVRRTLTLPPLQVRFGRHAAAIAFVSALLWTLHPLTSEIVNYVSQRTTGLMALCYLGTLYCGVRALDGRRFWQAAMVAACAAGMACKESMVTAPAVVLLFDTTCVFGSWRKAFAVRWHLYAGLVATWAVLAWLMASGGRTTVGFDTGVSAATYVLNQAAVLIDYLRLAVWPRALVVDYGAVMPVRFADVAIDVAVVVGLLAIASATMRIAPRAGFLGLTFFVLLAPTSSFVPIATEVGAERRMYLPLATLIILAVCLSYRAWGVVRSRELVMRHLPGVVLARGGAAAAVGVTIVASGLLATGTMARNREFDTPLTLARVTAERRPHGRAYYALAHELNEGGHRAEAMTLFARATTDFPPARFALGTELLAQGEIERGIEELRTFVSLAPLHPAVAGAHQMIGTAYFDQRRYADAAAELALALELEPRHARAQALMGESLLLQRRGAEAVEHLQRAVSLQPAQPRTRELLGHALAIDGRYADAERQFREVLRLDAQHTGARAALQQLEQLLAAPPANAGRQERFRR